MPLPARTIARLTPPGRGAVAVVQVSGPDAAEAVDRFLRTRSGNPLASLPIGRIAFGVWGATGESPGEELIAVRRSEEIVEVQCHGGDAAVESVARCLMELGFVRRSWQEAIAAAAGDPIQSSANERLPYALTLRTAAILLDQVQGAMQRERNGIVAQIEAGEIAGASDRLQALLSRAPVGLHLTDYWRVAVAGEPNVGKSSLMNAVVGFRRAIVHDLPGTTRDALTARTAIDGWPIEFIDTAGLRPTSDPLEAAGIAKARDEASRADLVLQVRDASQGTSTNHIDPPPSGARILPVWNKRDLVAPEWRPPTTPGEERGIVVSAATGEGIDMLLAEIVRRLILQVPPDGAAIPFTCEQCQTLARAAEALKRGDVELSGRELASV